jgi:autotransporter strand-loop-strand O-heptosyltransferase
MIYENLTKNNDTIKHSFNINFVQGAYLEIKSGGTDEFYCEFIDKSTNKVVYTTTLKSHHWSRVNKKYFIDWNVKVYQHNKLIYDYHFNCENKRVFIVLDSKSLGDTLAWFPMVDEFRKKHNCHVIVSTFHNDWFVEQYPELEFIEPGSTAENLYAMYNLGWYYFEGGDEVDLSRNVSDFRKIPLQQSASDILGLPPVEVRPKLKLNPEIKREKQVAIAIHSTAQSKYWNNPEGWNLVVDFLKRRNYKVKLLSRESDGYMGNKHPRGIEQLTPGPISKVIEELQKSEVFIGIGSGLSWMSWATNTPTILISGFSEGYSETQDKVYRITAPEGVCSGCYNRYKLDAGDWNWCPDQKNTIRQFECSKSIKATTVINELKKILGYE